ncbi:hypothetical protein EF834_00265 [Rhodococcus spongiicola]|uniref:Uncharacterized protein n=1 Tax=Rhodococcus spongiicola TaxID=2487352 RepID=A0A3S3ZQH4_9NOCA|nr:hypothetical protein EF834_00265 [Rhodococcus spongiicola]
MGHRARRLRRRHDPRREVPAFLTGTVGAVPTGTVGAVPTGTVGAVPTGTVGAVPTGAVGAVRHTATDWCDREGQSRGDSVDGGTQGRAVRRDGRARIRVFFVCP